MITVIKKKYFSKILYTINIDNLFILLKSLVKLYYYKYIYFLIQDI